MSDTPDTPGVYITETPPGPRQIAPVPTAITAFVGRTICGSVNTPIAISSFLEFATEFGGLSANSMMSFAVCDFFDNGGSHALIVRVSPEEGSKEITDSEIIGNPSERTGLYALENASLFNLLVIPPYNFSELGEPVDVSQQLHQAAISYCATRRAFYIMDAPGSWTSEASAAAGFSEFSSGLGNNGSNAALYFPHLVEINPLNNQPENFVPSGAVAGVFARTDAQRGVWKAPAGQGATLSGVQQLSVTLTDQQNGRLNEMGLNCLRSFPTVSAVIWGARTLAGADQQQSEWTYIPVRRTALFIEASLYQGTQWVVFEPNGPSLWAQIGLSIASFMQNLFQQGAFQGAIPNDAYFVKCDNETTTQTDIDNGIVNIVIGFAPLRPAEFVIIQISQIAGQSCT